MKHIIFVIVILSFVFVLPAQTTISKIAVNSRYSVATRVVITLSRQTDWSSVNDIKNRTITITLNNASSSPTPISGLAGNKLISAIQPAGNKIILSLKAPFYIEKNNMVNPYRIILDIFAAKNLTFLEHYELAVYHEDMLRLVSADQEYRFMLQKYPYSKDIYYFYARLQARRHNVYQAKLHFAEVPATSKFYKDAQVRLAELEGRTITPPAPQPTPSVAQSTTPVPEVTKPVVKTETPKVIKIAKVKKVKKSSSTSGMAGVSENKKSTGMTITALIKVIPLWEWMSILLILGVMIYLISNSSNNYSRKAKHRAPLAGTLLLDNETKKRLVNKRLENGMNVREITRDLRMKRSMVKSFIEQIRQENNQQT